MSDGIRRESIDFDIKPNVIVYGDVCECGHIATGEHRTSRIAHLKCRADEYVHRLRHPFKNREPFDTFHARMKRGVLE